MTDRDPTTGRFLPGNRAAEGNPSGTRGRPKRYAAEYADELHGTLTLAAWRRIVHRAIEQALNGDHRARQFLAGYVLGQPPQLVVADVNGTQERLFRVVDALRDALPDVEEGGA